MVYYYDVGVFDYEEHMELSFIHEKKYSHHEFVLIVQDCIDKVIKNYSEENEYGDNCPCMLDSSDIVRNNGFRVEMKEKGFKPLKVTASCSLEEKGIFNGNYDDVFIKDRYDDLVLGSCKECFREEDEECPVHNKRR